MADVDSLKPQGDKMRQVILWISETVRSHPEKKRSDILKEAEIRFDLSPRESDFLNSKLAEDEVC